LDVLLSELEEPCCVCLKLKYDYGYWGNGQESSWSRLWGKIKYAVKIKAEVKNYGAYFVKKRRGRVHSF